MYALVRFNFLIVIFYSNAHVNTYGYNCFCVLYISQHNEKPDFFAITQQAMCFFTALKFNFSKSSPQRLQGI